MTALQAHIADIERILYGPETLDKRINAARNTAERMTEIAEHLEAEMRKRERDERQHEREHNDFARNQ